MSKPLPYTLVLRKVKRDMTSHKCSRIDYKIFKYPDKGYVGVSTKEWDPAPCCGNGLHGLPWGIGSYFTIPDVIQNDSHGKWLVIKVLNKNMVNIWELNFIEKVKFKCGHVVFKGNKKDAIKFMLADPKCPRTVTKENIQSYFNQ
jgi:hypothetical protein